MKYIEIKYLILNILCCCMYVHNQEAVERKTDIANPQQPTRGASYFENENRLCIFSYCWNKSAKCSASFSCCRCKCKENTRTFFSKSDGCLSANQLITKSGNPDEQCNIFSKSFGFSDVPLFTNASHNQGTELITHSNFPFNNNVTCYAEQIYYFEYYSGTKSFLYHNRCQGIIKVRLDEQYKLVFYWGRRANEEWGRLGGRLLAVDIHCYTLTFTDFYSSCFLFQAAGKSGKDRLSPEPPLPSNFTCPTEIPMTIVTPTKLPSKSSNKIGIMVSVIVTVLILIAVLVLILFLWRRRKAQRKQSEENTRIIYDGQSKINTYEEQQVRKKIGRENSLKKEKDLLYVEVPDEQEYTAIDDDDDGHQYETPVIDMSKRPLPDCPQHINNPYYIQPPSQLSQNDNRDSGNNQLYSLYSSIDNLKPSS